MSKPRSYNLTLKPKNATLKPRSMKFALATRNINSIFSATDVDFGTDYKRGRAFQFCVHHLANRTIDMFHDKLGTFLGQKVKTYTWLQQPDRIPPKDVKVHLWLRPKSAQCQLQKDGLQHLGKYLSPIVDFIQERQSLAKSVVLWLDANKKKGAPPSQIKALADNCGLFEIHTRLFPGHSLPCLA